MKAQWKGERSPKRPKLQTFPTFPRWCKCCDYCDKILSRSQWYSHQKRSTKAALSSIEIILSDSEDGSASLGDTSIKDGKDHSSDAETEHESRMSHDSGARSTRSDELRGECLYIDLRIVGVHSSYQILPLLASFSGCDPKLWCFQVIKDDHRMNSLCGHIPIHVAYTQSDSAIKMWRDASRGTGSRMRMPMYSFLPCRTCFV